MNNFRVDILCYFENLETIRIRFNGDTNISDEDFYKNIFRILTKDELMEIYKISCCQICEDESEVIPLIRERSKIYFEESDEYTENLKNLKNQILLEKY